MYTDHKIEPIPASAKVPEKVEMGVRRFEPLTPEEMRGLNRLKDGAFMAPPGVDPRDEIARSMPTVEAMAASIEHKFVPRATIDECLGSTGLSAEATRELMDSKGVKVSDILQNRTKEPGAGEVVYKTPPNGRIELKKHWRSMLRSLPQGAEIKASGNLMMAQYPINPEDPESNIVRVIFDLGDESTKKQGMKIKGFYESKPNGETLDTKSLVGFEDVYFANYGLFWTLVRLGAPIAAVNLKMQKGEQDLKKVMTFYKFGDQKYAVDSSTWVHEGVHLRKLGPKTDPLNVDKAVVIGLERIAQTLGIPLSLLTLYMFGANPWLYAIPLMYSLSTYALSKVEGTAHNSALKEMMREEKYAFLMEIVAIELMRKNGYGYKAAKTPEQYTQSPYDVDALRDVLIQYYEPPVWAALDRIYLLSKGNKAPKPSPSTPTIDAPPAVAPA